MGRTIFCSSLPVRHFHVYYFFRVNIQLRESILSKEDYHKFLKFTNSSPDASDGRDHQQFMCLQDWKVPLPQQERLRLINGFSSIAGKLGTYPYPTRKCSVATYNILFAAICIPGICICFVFSSRIPHKKYKSAVTRSLTSRSESA